MKRHDEIEFNELNPDNCAPTLGTGQKTSRMTVGKTGTFHINKFAVVRLGLAAGDKIVLRQEKKNKENWFLVNLGKKGKGFELRQLKNNGDPDLGFGSSAALNKMCESFDLQPRTGLKFLFGESTSVNGDALWGLLKLPDPIN